MHRDNRWWVIEIPAIAGITRRSGHHDVDDHDVDVGRGGLGRGSDAVAGGFAGLG